VTTSELIENLSQLKSALQDSSEFVGVISEIAGRYKESITNLDAAFKIQDSSRKVQALEALKTHIAATINIIKGFSLPKVFIETEKTRESLERVVESVNDSGDRLGHLRNLLKEFQDEFEILIKGYEPSQVLQVITLANSLNTTRLVTVNLIDLVIEKLVNQIEVKDDEKELSLVLYSTDEYNEVLTKLEALNVIYSEFCFLFNVSTSEYPLRIIKIETGSLWIYVVGNAAIIGFVIWVLRTAILFYFRNFTNEGRVSLIPKEIQAADTILQFTKKLEESGIDTTKNKEEVQKVLITITQKLNNLVADQPSIKINDEPYSVGDAYEQKFLEESRKLLIGDGTLQNGDEAKKQSKK
jgi:hypothetical protein